MSQISESSRSKSVWINSTDA